jgi:acetate kinase
MRILSLNLGSSSLKCAVHDFSASVERCLIERGVATSSEPAAAKDAARAAIAQIVAEIGRVDAVGHRIVFGGNDDTPAIVTPEVVSRLEDLQSLDPLHAPGALAVIRETQKHLPDATHVACFDTAFFRDVPATAKAIAIPRADPLLRRYGFHGLSYESVVATLGSELQPRTIIAHLGNGASVAAIRDGHPIDMTMGFSALSGLIMSSRPGDIDPGVILYLLERLDMSAPELRDLLENRSGLRALSGGEGDVQRLCERSDDDAGFTVEMFVRSVAKAIGALTTELGGLDMLVFTGGIGEHNARIRGAIISRVLFLGTNVDVRIVRSDENLSIARNTVRWLSHGSQDRSSYIRRIDGVRSS